MATEVIETKLYGGEVTVHFYPKSHMYKVTDPKYGLDKQRVTGVTTYLGVKDKSGPLISWATETTGLYLYDIIQSGRDIMVDDLRDSMGKHREKKEEAAEIGTKMHEWCEYFINHKLGKEGFEKEPELPEDPQIRLGVDSFLEWYLAHDVEFIESEKVVYSRKHQYIGTMDLKAKVDGLLTSGDFKSSNGLYNSVLAQMSAYAKADEEEQEFLGQPIEYQNRVAVRLSKETESEYIERMKRKNIIKNRETSDFPEYEPFEWKEFKGRDLLDRDYEAFLTHKALFEWDKNTDFFLNK